MNKEALEQRIKILNLLSITLPIVWLTIWTITYNHIEHYYIGLLDSWYNTIFIVLFLLNISLFLFLQFLCKKAKKQLQEIDTII